MKKSTFSLVVFNFCVIVILVILFFRVSVLNEKLEKQYNVIKQEQKSNYDFQMKLNDIMLDRIYDLEGLDNNYCSK